MRFKTIIDNEQGWGKYCPECGKKQKYSSYSAFYTANKNNTKCRNCATILYAKRKGDPSLFNEESLVKYYWLGFVLADGNFSNNRLNLVLSRKDESHLRLLADILKVKVYYTTKTNGVGFSIMNKKVFGELCNKYEIQSNKTEHPPNIYSIIGDKLISLSIGFIDGDGNISKFHQRKDFKIGVKVHKSWLDLLRYMFGVGYINNAGYACSVISNTIKSKKLKLFAINNKLPIMKRKWDVIDLNYKSRGQIASERKDVVKKMLLNKKSRKEIMSQTGLSDSGLSMLIKRKKL